MSVSQVCRVEGCGRPVKRSDLCSPHYRRKTRGLSVDDYTPVTRRRGLGCEVPDCDRDHHALGFCNPHYLRHMKGKDLTPEISTGPVKECPEPDCTRPVRVKGLCRAHYNRKRSGSTKTGPIRDVNPRIGCEYDGCERPHSSHGLCATHSLLIRKYNISKEQVLSIPGKNCMICQGSEPVSGKSLSVDHDHSCCAGEKSCGKCVRGVLCSACNKALGAFKDSPEVLQNALKYLNNPTGL